MHTAIVIQRPGATADRLLLLFHGVGSVPATMVPLGQRLAQAWPTAMVVAVPSPFPSDISAGLQWFSVRGVTEENRPARIEAALPLFRQTVRHWQAEAGIDAAATVLVGFSQGAIMALEATRGRPPLAGSVLAFAGRYATLPDEAPSARIHLLHGEQDSVIGVEWARAAAARLHELGAAVTLDTQAGVGHEPHPALADRAIARLREVEAA